MAMLQEFKAFALKGNVVDLAIAVVIGTAFSKIVSALVQDLIMPILGRILSFLGNDWRTYEVTSLHLKVGDLLGAIIDFTIIAFVLFLIVVKLMGTLKSKDAPSAATHSRSCPECLETIPLAAKRCRCCGVIVAPAA